MLPDEPQTLEVFFAPACFIFDNLLQRSDRKDLPGTMEVDGDAAAVRVFEKTGCPFASCKSKSVSLERSDQAASREAAELRVVNGHTA